MEIFLIILLIVLILIYLAINTLNYNEPFTEKKYCYNKCRRCKSKINSNIDHLCYYCKPF